VSAFFWYQQASGVSISGTSKPLVSAFFWYQQVSGVSKFLVSAKVMVPAKSWCHFWCQPTPSVSKVLVPANFWCQLSPGASKVLLSAKCYGSVKNGFYSAILTKIPRMKKEEAGSSRDD